MTNEKDIAAPHVLDLRVGRCRLPYSEKDRGWVLPGGNIVFNRERATMLAATLDRDMKRTPHRWTVTAARAATEGR